MRRAYLFPALGILALLALTMFAINRQHYYPEVHVDLPQQGRLIFIDAPWTSEQKCKDANAKMIAAVAANCSQCKLTESCLTQIEPSRLKALEGRAIDAYVVHSGTLRILIDAADASKQACAAMAEQISRDKKQPARCVYPE